MIRFIQVLWILCFVLSTQVAYSQTYSISGQVLQVKSDNRPSGLAGVTVTVDGTAAATDNHGTYTIGNLSSGMHTVTGAIADYSVTGRTVTIAATNLAGQDLVAVPIGELMGGHVLGVIPLAARKDTAMLCLDGCKRTGDEAWNASREAADTLGHHDIGYCSYTAATMMNHYFGGTVTRDECALKTNPFSVPEQQLGHGLIFSGGGGGGVSRPAGTLNWALGRETANTIHTINLEPSEQDCKTAIDGGSPIYWAVNWGDGTGHAMIVSGYRYKDGRFQLLYLNVDNNGTARWVDKGTLGAFTFCMIPSADSLGIASEIERDENGNERDRDHDGVIDFDEIRRWVTQPTGYSFDLKEDNPDTDGDGLPDGKDIEGWLFRGTNDPIGMGTADMDGDGLRCEVDPDSDDDGILDGDEDLNHNANLDAGETNPYEPDNIDRYDSIRVKIAFPTLRPQLGTGKIFVKQTTLATFSFYHIDGANLVPYDIAEAASVAIKYTPFLGAPVFIRLSRTQVNGVLQGAITIDPQRTPLGKATFSVSAGASPNLKTVEIIDGRDFWIDYKASGVHK